MATPHVFVSYVRENSKIVDRLAQELRAHGITVWLDRKDLGPGVRWKRAIRRAIGEGSFFIACFSGEYNQKRKTFMNEELTLAIEELRQLDIDQVWFIPVKLSACEIPDWDIGGGETLQDLNYVELYSDWDANIRPLVEVIGQERPKSTPDGMVLIPAGTFQMGSKDGSDDEKPVHAVSVNAFYMEVNEVTNAQFKEFIDANPEWSNARITSEYHDGDYLKLWNSR